VKPNRLVTLVGSGGVAKTKPTIEAARSLSSTFSDGVHFAELANLPSGDYVPMNVATALGVPPADGCILEDRVTAALRDKRILLVLDNCVHLIDASANTVETLLRCAPFLVVIATSREPL
jgi:predicted ATPase